MVAIFLFTMLIPMLVSGIVILIAAHLKEKR